MDTMTAADVLFFALMAEAFSPAFAAGATALLMQNDEDA